MSVNSSGHLSEARCALFRTNMSICQVVMFVDMKLRISFRTTWSLRKTEAVPLHSLHLDQYHGKSGNQTWLAGNPSFFRCFFLLKLPLIVVFLAFHFTLVSASQKRWEDASKYRNLPRSEVLYLDDSGSMNGANLSEARGALRKMAHLLQDSPTRVCTWLGKTKIIYNIISRFVNCVNILYFYFLKLLHPESYYCRLWYTHIYIYIYIYIYIS